MVLLGFNMFRSEILSGEKRQTIRKLRKKPIMVGDRLHLYWKLRTKECRKLGEAICRESFFITIQKLGNAIRIDHYFGPVESEFSGFVTLSDCQMLDLAKRDGFRDVASIVEVLSMLHGKDALDGKTFFQVVRWGRLEKAATSRVR